MQEFSKNEIAEEIAFQLKRRLSKRPGPHILRIVGLPSCGKSSLADTVRNLLHLESVNCTIYEDSVEIIRSRQQRSLDSLSGIDYDIFDLTQMRRNLQSLLEGRNIEVPTYSHINGSVSNKSKEIQSADVIILDGYAWQNGIFRHLLEPEQTLTVALFPKEISVWKSNSIARDVQERNYDESEASKRFSALKVTFQDNAHELEVQEVFNYFNLVRSDPSRPTRDRYLYVPGPKSCWPPINIETERKSNIFLAYQFDDDELVQGLRVYLLDHGLDVIDGKMLDGRISDGILTRISQCRYFIAVMTKRDQLVDSGFTTSSWLLEEKGAAIMAGSKIILLTQEGVVDHYIGYLQSDIQKIVFTERNFSSKFPEVGSQLGITHT